MLSRESLLFALNSGCLNSQACQESTFAFAPPELVTYACAISCWTIPLVILPDFVEVVLVQLSDETRKVGMLEVFR